MDQSKQQNILKALHYFEEQVKIHAVNQCNVARGNIGANHAYESAKVLRTLRENLHKEIGL